MKITDIVNTFESNELDDPFQEPDHGHSSMTRAQIIEIEIRKIEALETYKRSLGHTLAKLNTQGRIVMDYQIGRMPLSQEILYSQTPVIVGNRTYYVLLTDKDAMISITRARTAFLKLKLNTLNDRKTELERERRKIKKDLAQITHKEKLTKSTQVTIHEKNVPQQIHAGKRKFGNPYFTSTKKSDRYAGSPDHYPWSPQMLLTYETLNNALIRNGLQPFSVMYAGKMNGTCWGVIAENGRFVWRKYDPSPSAGQNWLYIDGNQMLTSEFIGVSVTKQEQDNFLAPLKTSNI